MFFSLFLLPSYICALTSTICMCAECLRWKRFLQKNFINYENWTADYLCLPFPLNFLVSHQPGSNYILLFFYVFFYLSFEESLTMPIRKMEEQTTACFIYFYLLIVNFNGTPTEASMEYRVLHKLSTAHEYCLSIRTDIIYNIILFSSVLDHLTRNYSDFFILNLLTLLL